MEATSDRSIPHAITDRRPGDAAISVAEPSEAAERLGWYFQRSLGDICRDGWAWQQQNRMDIHEPAHILPTNPGDSRI